MPNEQILQNRYEIIQVLRIGGMGTIYLGVDRRLGIKVAIKEFSLISEDKLDSEIFRNAFADECQILAALSHHGIPKATDFFRVEGKDYFVMEFIGGSDLDKIIRRQNDHFNLNLVLDWFLQMLDIVEYLHTLPQPVFHRDLKPSNFKLTVDGKIKLLDFGIAKSTFNQNFIANKSLNIATFEFAPLEQLIKASSHVKNSLVFLNATKALELLETKTSASTDIFALGATLYQLLTNCLPPDAHVRALAVWSGKLDPILPLTSYDRDIPADLEIAVLQSLSLIPSDRPRSVKKLRNLISVFYVANIKTPVASHATPVTTSSHQTPRNPKSWEVPLTRNLNTSPNRFPVKRTAQTFFNIYQKRFRNDSSNDRKTENLENLLY